ncbi:hypothetical protein T03_1407 [Trichinella britovi]|uniref:Uncharacterized protein n=1 Tax=Trichinella britovi TaxID=45882 RepID=A0A0V1D4X3_TRIBR|nr:hypothetical protein T03_1407 [Trichinella britovi]
MEFHTCCNKCRLLSHFSCRKSHTFLDTCLITSAPGRFTVVAAHLNSVAPQVPLTSHRPQGGDIAHFWNHCVKGNVAKLQIAKMKIDGVQHLVCTKHPSVNSTRRIHHGAYHLQL